MQTSLKASKWPGAFALLFVLVFALFAYTFFHEGGHAFFGLLFGGTLTRFNVDFITFSAHVGMDGNFSVVQRAIISAAGVGLPIVLWTLYLLLGRKPKSDNVVHFWLMLFGTVMSYSALMAWIVIPILVSAGQTVSDDSANFLQITGAPPLLVSAAALLVFAGGLGLYLTKMGGFHSWRKRIIDIKNSPALTQDSFITLRILAATAIVLGFATIGLNRLAASADPTTAPEGYELAFEANFSEGQIENEVLYEMELEQPAEVSFFLVLDDFNRVPMFVQLWGPDGLRFEFLRFEQDGRIGHATANPPPMQLDSGTYQIRMTAQQENSSIRGFIKVSE